MKTIKMKYGNTSMDINIHDEKFLGIIESKKEIIRQKEEEVILKALKNPIDSKPLREIVKPSQKICIIISDVTRAWQKMSFYLPFIVDELKKSGIEDKDITFLCATGTHRRQTKEEHKLLLGDELSKRFGIIDHDCLDEKQLVYLGKTSFQTPVKINKKAIEADHIILTGAIVFHDLAGFGGGRKSILPGIASFESIMANHALALNKNIGEGSNSEVRCGSVDKNPIHQDMIEAADFVKPSFLFNVILNDEGSIVKAVSGHYKHAHEIGQKMVDALDGVWIREKADLVIASAGGYPKDMNLYQATKALSNAKEAVKLGGSIIILSECIEGFGNEDLRQIIEDYKNNRERECAVREKFTVAKYIGYDMAETSRKWQILFVSDIEKNLLDQVNITVVKTVKEALDIVYNEKGKNIKTYLMPHGGNTLPKIEK
ncbi:nickel-dependent lactate racemase [Crassaminicella profunda]|uniref:nickel-dependent lactate racemase n=1 Tax=Crassaminicella profunda TaxID=1286698 RepID=UPI001CA74ADC|nr:nickel-dependent lactate racemase [Crassaminicella profunda]QZY56210.1 nickel-dependent lactate racemase [Crassaminicella profunda]